MKFRPDIALKNALEIAMEIALEFTSEIFLEITVDIALKIVLAIALKLCSKKLPSKTLENPSDRRSLQCTDVKVEIVV